MSESTAVRLLVSVELTRGVSACVQQLQETAKHGDEEIQCISVFEEQRIAIHRISNPAPR